MSSGVAFLKVRDMLVESAFVSEVGLGWDVSETDVQKSLLR